MSSSPFDSLFAAHAAPKLFASFGVAGSYRSPAGSTTNGLTLIVEQAAATVVYADEELTKARREAATVSVEQSALAAPAPGGRFTVGSDEWTITEEPPRLDCGVWRCDCARVARASRAEGRARYG